MNQELFSDEQKRVSTKSERSTHEVKERSVFGVSGQEWWITVNQGNFLNAL